MDKMSFKKLLGVHQGKSYDAVQKLPRAVSTLSDDSIPDSFDSETNWPQCAKVIGDIRDQSMCGCCWAFAGAEAASDRLCISTNGTVAVPLSAQDVCFGASFDGCQGGQIDTPWQYISDSGAVTGGQVGQTYPVNGQKGLCSDFTLPHCHHHGPQGADPYPAEGTPGCESQSSPAAPTKCDSNAASPHADWSADKWSFDGQVQSASGEQGIQKAIMEGGQLKLLSLSTLILPTTSLAFTIMSVVVSRVVMRFVLSDGVLMLVPSTGRLPTHGTRTGVRKVTFASSVVTASVALRMVLLSLVLMPSGPKENKVA